MAQLSAGCYLRDADYDYYYDSSPSEDTHAYICIAAYVESLN